MERDPTQNLSSNFWKRLYLSFAVAKIERSKNKSPLKKLGQFLKALTVKLSIAFYFQE